MISALFVLPAYKNILVIQGLADADVGGKLTQKLVEQTVEFCCHAFDDIATGPREMLPRKVAANHVETKEDLERLDEDERAILRTIRARQILRAEDTMNINNFSQEAVDGLVPRLIRETWGWPRCLIALRLRRTRRVSSTQFRMWMM